MQTQNQIITHMKTQLFSMPRIMVRGMVWISIMILSLANMQTAYAEPQNSEKMIEPSAVMQNVEMNVMYRGYANKYAISVPGIPNDKVMVEAEGATVKKGQTGIWMITPFETSKSVKVTIYADIKGQKKAMSTQRFAVKVLPKPEAWLVVDDHSYRSGDKVPFSALMNEAGKLEAGYGPNDAFNLQLEVISFRAVINGVMMDITGNTFTDAQRERIQKLKKGSTVVITDIRTRTQDGMTIPISPVVFIVE